MQGENFESAREEIDRDQVARTPKPPSGWDPAVERTVKLAVRLVIPQTISDYSPASLAA